MTRNATFTIFLACPLLSGCESVIAILKDPWIQEAVLPKMASETTSDHVISEIFLGGMIQTSTCISAD